MSDDELRFMEKVARRFASSPVLFRFALANGLNGRPMQAEQALTRLCKLHSKTVCEDAARSWKTARETNAGLADFPSLRP